MSSPNQFTTRKKRLMVAGEFSSGKSQLINRLLEHELLPSNVTSTSMPPIWVIQGEGDGIRVDLNETVTPLTSLEDVDVESTLFCVVKSSSPFLEHYDLIDTPGNSDPNIPSICWERMLTYADVLVWCSNAVQAWRQSEKAVWDELDVRHYIQSSMLITHADRLVDEQSAEKVERRVRRDAAEYFEHFLMKSLIDAADVAEIREHLLENVLPRIDCVGEDRSLVEALRTPATVAKPVTPTRPTRTVVPRRPSQIRKVLADAARKPEKAAPIEAAKAEESSESVPNVTPLFCKDEGESTCARNIWKEITEFRTPATMDDWKNAVETLLTRLEGTSDAPAEEESVEAALTGYALAKD
ncbi:dynamin family protein [Aliiroseovarius sp. 2305UL8-7]|uniref:dynamin family protein n=1 Tax=Aliiroseovarius conchicola TaxID=3121637 RepID=UPI0035291469